MFSEFGAQKSCVVIVASTAAALLQPCGADEYTSLESAQALEMSMRLLKGKLV